MACFIENDLIATGEAKGIEDVERFVLGLKPDLVVLENYLPGRRPSRASEALRLIGAIEYMCQKNSIRVVFQSPSCISHLEYLVRDLIETSPRSADLLNRRSPHICAACAHVVYWRKSQKK